MDSQGRARGRGRHEDTGEGMSGGPHPSGSTPRPMVPKSSYGHGRSYAHETPGPSGGGNGGGGGGSQAGIRGIKRDHEGVPAGRSGDPGRSDTQRGGARGKRIITDLPRTRPTDVNSKKGTTGTSVNLLTNYFRLSRRPEWQIYQYRVDFSPEIELAGLRKRLIYEQKPTFGGYLFDGQQLFLTKKLPNDITEFKSKDREENPIDITVKYTTCVDYTQAQSTQILNIILRRAMEGLKLQLVGRNFFDAESKMDVPEYNIQLWPGYQTSIRQHESDILLCCEIQHKVMRTETVLDILRRCHQEEREWKIAFQAIVIGMVVLTAYNNKTYRVDDVNFDQNPTHTFDTKKGPVSFINYYKDRYNLTIRDTKQPLLLSKAKARDLRGGRDELMALIPELCRTTGLSEEMKGNMRLMREISSYIRLGPQVRIDRLNDFNRRLTTTPASLETISEWNLKLQSRLVDVNGRVLPPQNIVFGNNNKQPAGELADWTPAFRNNSMFSSVRLNNWFVIVPPRLQRVAEGLVEVLLDVARGMRFELSEPLMHLIEDDKQHSYSKGLEDCANRDAKLIMVCVPNDNSDRYSNIKKKCCVERAIPTQVVTSRTMTPKNNNTRSLMSVATKIAIQMNCKIGGAPWMVEIPMKGVMIIGYDTCHDASNKSRSFGAIVATMDLKQCSSFYSAVSAHSNGEEMSNDITLNINKAISQFREVHHALPERICFYRDGLGDGQIPYVMEHEVKTLQISLENIYKSAQKPVKLIFIIVSKSINTRLFLGGNNPKPGTVVDDVITMPERYDFYLVSQSVRQGTVSPTSYNVIYDTLGLNPDRVQQLTYKMTHLYFNWSGTTRVPAVCQYAHKLAFLVSQHIHQSPSHLMEKQLYFL